MAKRRVYAAYIEEYRKPFRVGWIDVEVPDDWVPVQVRAVGVCGRDLVIWKGGFPNLKPPIIPGHEVFGYHNGKPVTIIPALIEGECPGPRCRRYQIFGEGIPGGYADRIYVPGDHIVPLPDDGFEKYAAAACGVATMIHASRVAGVSPGDRVLITGAAGGVGVHGIQLLTAMGVHVYAYVRNERQAEILSRELGVEVVRDLYFYRQHGRVDVVFEMVGEPTINESMRSLRFGGTMVLLGNVTGAHITIKRPALLIMRQLKIAGTAGFSPAEWLLAIKMISQGRIRPYYKKYPLQKINEAIREAVEDGRVGRIVLEPPEEPPDG